MRVLSVLASVLVLSACAQSAAPVTVYGVTQGPGSAGVHGVSRGETLWTISQRYNIAMRDIVIENNLKAPFVLTPGQRLILPPPREYQVRSGDSVSSISRLFDVSSSEVVRLNDIQAPYALRVGEVLRLPSPSVQPPVSAVVTSSVSSGAVPSAAIDRAVLSDGVPVPASKPIVRSEEIVVAESGTPIPPKKPAINKSKVKKSIATPKRASTKFLKPVQGRTVSGYGPTKDGLHNDGINILAARGTPVQAAENGVVVYAGNGLKGSGNLVLVRHADRWMTAYGHLDSIKVRNGAVVKRGQSLGGVGSTGAVNTPQLHFEVRRGTKAINPKPYLE